MKRLMVLGVLLLTGCVRYEVVPTDALVQKWTWERVVVSKKECCSTCAREVTK